MGRLMSLVAPSRRLYGAFREWMYQNIGGDAFGNISHRFSSLLYFFTTHKAHQTHFQLKWLPHSVSPWTIPTQEGSIIDDKFASRMQLSKRAFDWLGAITKGFICVHHVTVLYLPLFHGRQVRELHCAQHKRASWWSVCSKGACVGFYVFWYKIRFDPLQGWNPDSGPPQGWNFSAWI